jgi:hypothetical protein
VSDKKCRRVAVVAARAPWVGLGLGLALGLGGAPAARAAEPPSPAAKAKVAKTWDELVATVPAAVEERALLDALIADCDKAEPGAPVFACRDAQAKALGTVVLLADRPYKAIVSGKTDVEVTVDGSLARKGFMGGPFFTVGAPKTLLGPDPAAGVGLSAPGLVALKTKLKAKTPADAERWAAGGLQVDLVVLPTKAWGVAHGGSWFSGAEVAVLGWRAFDRTTGAVAGAKPSAKPGAVVETPTVKAAALAAECAKAADAGDADGARRACDAAAALDTSAAGLADARAKVAKLGVAAEAKLCVWASTRDDAWFAWQKCSAVLAADPDNAEAKAAIAAIPKKARTPDEVKAVMKKAMGPISKCGLAGSGKMTLVFRVRGDGVPQEVAVKPPADETAAGKCVIDAMKKVKFPSFGAAASEPVTWPFELF